MRLVGLPKSIVREKLVPIAYLSPEIPYASEIEVTPKPAASQSKHQKYPYIRGRGPLDASLACFRMLSQYL